MANHSFDDLINEQRETKKGANFKGLLTIVALFIVVMLIAIMMTKMVLDKSGDENVTEPAKEPQSVESNKSEGEKENSIIKSEISSDLKPDTTSPQNGIDEEEENIDEDENETVDIAPTTGDINSIILPKTSEVVTNNADNTVAQEPKKSDTVNPETPEIPTTGIPAFEETPLPSSGKPESKKDSTKEKQKETTTQKKKETTTNRHSDNGRGGNYRIQVGNFSQRPSGQFLQRIKNSGYSYKLLPNGKLMVGGYPSKEAAARALPGVRDKINKDAFIVDVK